MKLFLLAAVVAATMLPPVAEAITFSYTDDYETFTVPTAGNYRFVVKGASGGGSVDNPFNDDIVTYGGAGVTLTSILSLAAGEVFHIVVGSQGSYGSAYSGSGGGGGSFAVSASNMVIAGGGGGASIYLDGRDGQTGTSGGDGSRGGGVGGYGGNGGYIAGGGGGGGLYGAGFEGERYDDDAGGRTFYGGFGGDGGQDLRNAYSGALSNGDYFGLQGGSGTDHYYRYPGPPAGFIYFYGGPGGFGGGGGASWFGGGGGGGGFSGGGGGAGAGSFAAGGGGGGSISTGTILSFSTNVGYGEVSIDLVSSVPEPSTWPMLLSGFGLIGFALRRIRRRTVSIDSGPPNHGVSTVQPRQADALAALRIKKPTLDTQLSLL